MRNNIGKLKAHTGRISKLPLLYTVYPKAKCLNCVMSEFSGLYVLVI